MPEAELEERLNTLFADYYRESQGQKLVRCVYFPADRLGNLEAIQEAKKRVEAQLKHAKSTAAPSHLKEFLVLKISMGNLTFFDINYGQMKEQKNPFNANLEREGQGVSVKIAEKIKVPFENLFL